MGQGAGALPGISPLGSSPLLAGPGPRALRSAAAEGPMCPGRAGWCLRGAAGSQPRTPTRGVGEPAQGRPCPPSWSRFASPAQAAAAPVGSAERGGSADTEPRVSMGCFANPYQTGGTYQPLRNAVPGDVEPFIPDSPSVGRPRVLQQWQGHSLLCEWEAGFVLKRPGGAVSVGREWNSGGWCFSSDPRGTETTIR